MMLVVASCPWALRALLDGRTTRILICVVNVALALVTVRITFSATCFGAGSRMMAACWHALIYLRLASL